MPESLFKKYCRLQACNFIKKETWHSCFPVNFVKFPRTSFLTEHLWWLVLRKHVYFLQHYYSVSYHALKLINIEILTFLSFGTQAPFFTKIYYIATFFVSYIQPKKVT